MFHFTNELNITWKHVGYKAFSSTVISHTFNIEKFQIPVNTRAHISLIKYLSLSDQPETYRDGLALSDPSVDNNHPCLNYPDIACLSFYPYIN
jgi:hypothetical protein